jgi:hypothetical protein
MYPHCIHLVIHICLIKKDLYANMVAIKRLVMVSIPIYIKYMVTKLIMLIV